MTLACLPPPINSYHYLVYVLLEDLNQISRTEKCHFAFYIFHEQRFRSFTSRFVKPCVVAWCFLWFISICKYMYKRTKKQTSYIMWISGFYFVTVLTYRHMRKHVVVRKLKFKIWQYVMFFHANWLILFISNFIKNQYCVKITAIKFIVSPLYCLHG